MIQHDRVRAIYKYALDNLPKDQCQDVYKKYTIHEKKYGDRAGIEDVIVSKRKFQYEEVILISFLIIAPSIVLPMISLGLILVSAFI